jgi:hypothetical protein
MMRPSRAWACLISPIDCSDACCAVPEAPVLCMHACRKDGLMAVSSFFGSAFNEPTLADCSSRQPPWSTSRGGRAARRCRGQYLRGALCANESWWGCDPSPAGLAAVQGTPAEMHDR